MYERIHGNHVSNTRKAEELKGVKKRKDAIKALKRPREDSDDAETEADGVQSQPTKKQKVCTGSEYKVETTESETVVGADARTDHEAPCELEDDFDGVADAGPENLSSPKVATEETATDRSAGSHAPGDMGPSNPPGRHTRGAHAKCLIKAVDSVAPDSPAKKLKSVSRAKAPRKSSGKAKVVAVEESPEDDDSTYEVRPGSRAKATGEALGKAAGKAASSRSSRRGTT